MNSAAIRTWGLTDKACLTLRALHSVTETTEAQTHALHSIVAVTIFHYAGWDGAYSSARAVFDCICRVAPGPIRSTKRDEKPTQRHRRHGGAESSLCLHACGVSVF